MENEENRYHPIIDKPWEYDIIEFRYHIKSDTNDESFIDIYFKKEKIIRKLRFTKPMKLIIGEDFPHATSGFCILDIKKRQWDGINIEVGNFEQGDSITFYSQDVIDLDVD